MAEQLSVYQATLKEKTRQMKAMAAELNMYQAQVTSATRFEKPQQETTCASTVCDT